MKTNIKTNPHIFNIKKKFSKFSRENLNHLKFYYTSQRILREGFYERIDGLIKASHANIVHIWNFIFL